MKTKYLITALTISMVLLMAWHINAFACCRSRNNGESRGYTAGYTQSYHHVPPNVLPQIAPPGFPSEFFAKEVVKSFNKNGLKIKKADTIEKTGYNSHFLAIKEGIQFSTPSSGDEIAGCILSFKLKNDLNKLQKHYLKLNKKGELYSWSFKMNNILVVLKGSMVENEARKYEKVLYDLENIKK